MAYFQDYSEEQQQAIWDAVEKLTKEMYPEYKEEAKDCNMDVNGWLHEKVDDYINCGNSNGAWEEYLI